MPLRRGQSPNANTAHPNSRSQSHGNSPDAPGPGNPGSSIGSRESASSSYHPQSRPNPAGGPTRRSPAGPQRRPFIRPAVNIGKAAAAPTQQTADPMGAPVGDPASRINSPAPMPAFMPLKLAGMR